MTVTLHPLARGCWPFLPVEAPASTWWQGPLGELVQVLEDGTAEPLEGFTSVAQDPCAGRRPGTAGLEVDIRRRAGGDGGAQEAPTGDLAPAAFRGRSTQHQRLNHE